MQWTGTIWTIIKEGHMRIIPAKFGQYPASSLGGDVLWSMKWSFSYNFFVKLSLYNKIHL